MNTEERIKLLDEKIKIKKELYKIQFLKNKPQYRETPATILEFIEGEEYLNIGNDVYPEIKKILVSIIGEDNRELDKVKFREIIIVAGIGSGKSYLSAILLMYSAHWLLCLKDPFGYFGLSKDKPLVLTNMGLNATQAKEVVFKGLKTIFGNCKWFKKFNNRILSDEIQIAIDNKTKNPIIHVVSGNSKETAPIGRNIFAGALDEAAFYYDDEDKPLADSIFASIKGRITSRFKNRAGFVMAISSVKFEEDFIMRKYEESFNFPNMFGIKKATWEVIDRDKLSKQTFDFPLKRDKVTGEVTEWLKNIPINYKEDFEKNPEQALRDLASIPSLSIQGFFRDHEIIDNNINTKRHHPLDKEGRFRSWFKPEDNTYYYIHVDLALGKRKGDAAGFAMGHFAGYQTHKTETGRIEKRPKIVIDLMMAMRAETGRELNFEKIREFIYDIQGRGFRIKKVTFDGWQSKDSQQLLKNKGIKAEELSVDRTLKPYYALKEALLEERLDYYNYPVFIKELKNLEEIKGKKIDHIHGGSKDVSDAVAGVCFNCSKGIPTSGILF